MPSKKPFIGISMAYYDVKSYAERKYHVMEAYVEAIKEAGGIPVLFPILHDDDIDLFLDRVQGVLFTGGGGLLPHVKKMERLPSLEIQNPVRHRHDRMIAQKALERKLPIMGLCRGHQVINEVLGGTLIENLKDVTSHNHNQEESAEKPSHLVSIKKGSLLSKCFLEKEEVAVNSLHSQAIDKPGKGLVVTAVSEDHVIEAVEGTNGQFILGLQFHPEYMFKQDDVCLNPYRAFIDACRS